MTNIRHRRPLANKGCLMSDIGALWPAQETRPPVQRKEAIDYTWCRLVYERGPFAFTGGQWYRRPSDLEGPWLRKSSDQYRYRPFGRYRRPSCPLIEGSLTDMGPSDLYRRRCDWYRRPTYDTVGPFPHMGALLPIQMPTWPTHEDIWSIWGGPGWNMM